MPELPGAVPRRAAVLREGVPRAARGRLFHVEPAQDYQFGEPFTIWDELSNTAHWRNRLDPDQPLFAVFKLEVTDESRIFPTSPAQG